MEHSRETLPDFTISLFGRPEPKGFWGRLLVQFREPQVYVRVVFHDPDAPCPRCRVRLARAFERKFEGIIDEVEARPSLAHMDLLIRKERRQFMDEGDYDFIKAAVADQVVRCMDEWHPVINRKLNPAV